MPRPGPTRELEEETQCIRAWVAHAAHANTWRLRRDLCGGSMIRVFTPKPERPLVPVIFGAGL